MTKTVEEAGKPEFKVVVENELKRCLRYQNFASLLLLSVSRGTISEGSYGPMAVTGDRLIGLLRSALRETDVIDLQGEDMITVLLLYSDKRIARAVGDRLKTWINHYLGAKQEAGAAKVYLGGACFPSHATDYGILYQRASQMVEKARSIGQDQVLIFE